MPRNSDSVDLDPELIRNKIEAEVKAGRMAGPFKSPPFSFFHVSPISLREKSVPNTYWLIHNLSYPYDNTSVNGQMEDSGKFVKYATVLGLKTGLSCIFLF